MFGLVDGQPARHGVGGGGAQVILYLGKRSPAGRALASKAIEQLV